MILKGCLEGSGGKKKAAAAPNCEEQKENNGGSATAAPFSLAPKDEEGMGGNALQNFKKKHHYPLALFLRLKVVVVVGGKFRGLRSS